MSQAENATSETTSPAHVLIARHRIFALGALLLLVMVAGCHAQTQPLPSSTADAASQDSGDGNSDQGNSDATAPRPSPLLFQQSVIREGISVEFGMQHVDPAKRDNQFLQEGDDVRIRFKINDTASGTPVTAVYPAAWMDLIPPGEIPEVDNCVQKAQAFIGGNLFSKAELDLNVYYVLTLNDEASISVVDPLFGFGGSKLLSIVLLESPGEDWVVSTDTTRLFVTMPDCGKVAVVDTQSWEVVKSIPVSGHPRRVALQPDETYLWVADEEPDLTVASGVTLVNASTFEVASQIITGKGRHEIAFSDDSRWAFVTNVEDGTISLIDVRQQTKLADIPTATRPASIAYCSIAGMAYVSHAGDGTIVAVDAKQQRIVARIQAEPGLGQIRFAPDGRLGFVVNPFENVVHILDPAANRIVQTADVEEKPYQVTFTDELAYVRHLDTATVLMLPLAALGQEGRAVQVFDFPGGQIAPGGAARLSPADAITQAPGAAAVLVANPLDKAVYFYKEGMAAPMGNFSNYGRQPRAVNVIDRSLRERSSAGVYETTARLRRPGKYDVVFFLDAPRVVHCFPIEVQPDPELEAERNTGKIKVEHLTEPRRLTVKDEAQIKFRLTDLHSGEPLTGLEDVEVLTNLVPNWHRRHLAVPAEDGLYTLDFAPPQVGLYYIYVQCDSRGMNFNNDQYLVVEAVREETLKGEVVP